MLKKIIDIVSGKSKTLKKLAVRAAEVSVLELELIKLSDKELLERSLALRARVAAEFLENQGVLDDILAPAFALVREASRRVLGQRHFDVQLMGGAVLHRGGIAEMATGEGKTLAATAPAYLNALSGKGVHVVTVNDYLAKRDVVWMGQIYSALGLSVGCLTHEAAYLYDPAYTQENQDSKLKNQNDPEQIASQFNGATNLKSKNGLDKERDTLGSFKVIQEFLRPVSRKEAYLADITYGTNHEFGFDYLRDNLAYDAAGQVQRDHHYVIIDEVDSILIDEARTPLIISAPDIESSKYYRAFADVVRRFVDGEDYAVEEKLKSVAVTDAGIDKVERILGLSNIYSAENIKLVHYLTESLKAKTLFKRDKEYVVKDGEIVIVDEFTGRLMFGRRYSGGLHQAIEAKEGVAVKEESRTYAQITIQNYFRLYSKIAGMTGTAQTSAEEFHKVYNLDAVSIPTNKTLIRKDYPDAVYKTLEVKFEAAVKEVKERNRKGQPVLIGTVSIEKNELVSDLLNRVGVRHEVLNAKNHEREGAIIAQAGRLGAVTVATNMAGRGVDIVLGGNPPDASEAQKAKELGGLFVIGTERHEARRIDNQLRGRSGRQGDPGETRFFISLEDDLLRIFGGEKLKRLMSIFNLPDDVPIESKAVSKAISQSQSKVEGINFDARRHLLDFDDILNKQRHGVYAKRRKLLESDEKDLKALLKEIVSRQISSLVERIAVSSYTGEWLFDELKKNLLEIGVLRDEKLTEFDEFIADVKTSGDKDKLKGYLEEISFSALPSGISKAMILNIFDALWMEHLEQMDALRDAVGMRAYAQHNPLVEYRREGHRLYNELTENFEMLVFSNVFKMAALTTSAVVSSAAVSQSAPRLASSAGTAAGKIGRNDPCPCGSGKKYKKCHGK